MLAIEHRCNKYYKPTEFKQLTMIMTCGGHRTGPRQNHPGQIRRCHCICLFISFGRALLGNKGLLVP
jgi:hypothetical protein